MSEFDHLVGGLVLTTPHDGPVARALAADINALSALGAPFSATLAQTAMALARSLDDGPENTTASVAKELRATLDKLQEGARNDDGLDLSGLSTPGNGPA